MRKIYYLGLLLLLISTASVNAQVTIGKDSAPHGGALLDLQQPDATTKKGLKLPVVSLSDVDQYGLTSGVSTTAIGMVVYNDNPSIKNGNGVGLYVWDGNNWSSLGGSTVTDPCAGNNPVVGTPANDTPYTIKAGLSQSLTVSASCPGGGVPTYQWQSSSDKSAWSNISDATAVTYSTPTTAKGVIYYQCKVTNACGTTESKVFTVTVGCPTSVTDVEGNVYCTNVFGSAGEWMTENLRSTWNDVMASEVITLTESPNPGSDYTAKFATYPNKTKGNAESMGLLYTWAAATNRTSSNDEGYGQTATPRTQGICPSGWHLPSDTEWTDLEKVIAASDAGVYSDSIASPWNDDYYKTTNYRPVSGKGHGSKMKGLNKVNGQVTNGVSKAASAGGFDSLLVGYVDGTVSGFGTGTDYWSSSSAGKTVAWYRVLSYSRAGVGRSYHTKSNLFSVRCKKN